MHTKKAAHLHTIDICTGKDAWFEKDIQVQAFDPTSIIIVGGMPAEITNSRPEVLFNKKECFVNFLPTSEEVARKLPEKKSTKRSTRKGNENHHYQSLVLTAGDFKLLNCGGGHEGQAFDFGVSQIIVHRLFKVLFTGCV